MEVLTSIISINYRGTIFDGYNQPKRTPTAAKKSAVLAKVGNITQSWQDAIYNRAG